MPVNTHRAGGGRNRGEATARHRNTRSRGHRVADLFGSFLGRLLAKGRDYIPARASKCRCSKRKQEDNGHATLRPTTQAGTPDRGCHGMILRLLAWKNNQKLQTGDAARSPPPAFSLPRGNARGAGDQGAPLLLRSGCRRRRPGFDKWRRPIPISNPPPASAPR